MKLIIFIIAFVMSLAALGETTTQPAVQPVQPTLPIVNGSAASLGSVAGIMVLTVLIVEFAKIALAGHAFFGKVPLIVYVVSIALALTMIASLVLHTLAGSVADNIVNTFVAAMGASGGYSLLTDGTQSLKKVASCILLCLMVAGCTTRADLINTRETLWNGETEINKRDVTYLQSTTSPSEPHNALYDSGMLTHQKLQDFVNTSRSHDSLIPKGSGQ